MTSIASLIFCFFSICLVPLVLGQTVVIHGRVVNSDGQTAPRYLVIQDGIFQSIQSEKPKELLENPAEKTGFIETTGYIYPGLIDLHAHLTYNILPVWEHPIGAFSNRFEWRQDENYKATLRPAYNALASKETNFYNSLILFDELQAVAGGTTLIQESKALDVDEEQDEDPNEIMRLMVVRGTDFPSDLELDHGRVISIIDLFDYRVTMDPKPKKTLDYFAALRQQNSIAAFLPHLAEGRTGYLRAQDPDAYSRKEFEAFMNHELFSDPQNTPKPPIALIHASGMDTDNPQHVAFLREWNMGIIWSPVSNLLLYGDTLNVDRLIEQGIPIALGSDWSPSGSKHVLDEARMARFYLNHVGSAIREAELFRMMTVNAARLIGHDRLGKIEEGYLADLFIIDDPQRKKSDAMETLFYSSTDNIRLVMVGGRAVYGDTAIIDALSDENRRPFFQPLPEAEGIADKLVFIDPRIRLNLQDTVEQIENYLKENFQMKRSNTLSSRDNPYQERLKKLRSYIQNYFPEPKPDLKPEEAEEKK